MEPIPSRFYGRVLSGTLLIAGTCIGAGMLATPVITAHMGFGPSIGVNFLCWLFTMCTGMLVLEATLWMPDGANFFSMAKKFLGSGGKWLTGSVYLFLYYSLLVGYFSAAEPTVRLGLGSLGLFPSSAAVYTLLCATFFVIVVLGLSFVDRVNTMLMGGLVSSFVCLLVLGSSEVNITLLQNKNWGIMLLAAPTVMSAYGFHNIIPSLCTYLERDAKVLRWAIFIGSLAAFATYTIWQWLILGSISVADLEASRLGGEAITQTMISLENLSGSTWITRLGIAFSFFALVTSLLGVSFGMVDFFADSFGVSHEGTNRVRLSLLVFVPPVFFAAGYPGIFLDTMAYAGGFGETLINGLLPVAMVFSGRYVLKLSSKGRLPGGRCSLALLFLAGLGILYLESLHLMDVFAG